MTSLSNATTRSMIRLFPDTFEISLDTESGTIRIYRKSGENWFRWHEALWANGKTYKGWAMVEDEAIASNLNQRLKSLL